MQIYPANQKNPLKVVGYVNPNDITQASAFWGAPTFETDCVYRQGDVTAPTKDNGYYYSCTVNGISDTIEPKWTEDPSDFQISGAVTFQPIPWDLWLIPPEIITASTWTSTKSVPTFGSGFTDTFSYISFGPFDTTISEFKLTNKITKSTGETLSRTFSYSTVKEEECDDND